MQITIMKSSKSPLAPPHDITGTTGFGMNEKIKKFKCQNLYIYMVYSQVRGEQWGTFMKILFYNAVIGRK